MTEHLPATDDPGTRERLLLAALTLFTSRGYAATSVREIVAEAGVTKPALYYHFGSKEGLYVALLEQTLALFHRQIETLAATPGSARARILHFCAESLTACRAHLPAVRLLFAIFYGPPQGAPHFDIAGLFDRLLATIRAMLEGGIAAGEFRPLPVAELTWAVVGILNTVLEEQICRNPPRIDGVGLTVALGIFLDGIAAGDKP